MRRIAAPMVGGVFTSFAGELIVYPAIYFIWRSVGLKHGPLFPHLRAKAAGTDTV
jgi:Cu(I)/Ag(I) efflux system membrane protein CusA/SilA